MFTQLEGFSTPQQPLGRADKDRLRGDRERVPQQAAGHARLPQETVGVAKKDQGAETCCTHKQFDQCTPGKGF